MEDLVIIVMILGFTIIGLWKNYPIATALSAVFSIYYGFKVVDIWLMLPFFLFGGYQVWSTFKSLL